MQLQLSNVHMFVVNDDMPTSNLTLTGQQAYQLRRDSYLIETQVYPKQSSQGHDNNNSTIKITQHTLQGTETNKIENKFN